MIDAHEMFARNIKAGQQTVNIRNASRHGIFDRNGKCRRPSRSAANVCSKVAHAITSMSG